MSGIGNWQDALDWDDERDFRGGVPSGSEPEPRHSGRDAGAHHRPQPWPPQPGDSAGDPDVHGNPFEMARQLGNTALDPEDEDEISRGVQARSRARMRARLAADDEPGDTFPALDGPDDLNELTAPARRAEAREREARRLATEFRAWEDASPSVVKAAAHDAERERQAELTRRAMAGLGIAAVGHEPGWL